MEHVSEGLRNGGTVARGVLSAAKYFEEFRSVVECFEAVLQLCRGSYMFGEICSVFRECVGVCGIIFQSSEARWTYHRFTDTWLFQVRKDTWLASSIRHDMGMGNTMIMW